MKKLFCILLGILLTMALLSACGKDPAVTTPAPVPAESSVPAPETKAPPAATSKAAPQECTPAAPPESVPETPPAVPETTENVPETSPVQPPETVPETPPAVPETTAPEPETTVDHPQGGTGPATETTEPPTEPPTEPSTHAPVETETDSEGRLSALRRYDENDRLIEETVYRESGKTDYTAVFEYYDNGAKKSESRQDYDENGLAGRYERIEYHEDGESVRLKLTRSDQEYRYEYDAQGREIRRETRSLDGTQLTRRVTHEYAGESSDDYVYTEDYLLSDGRMVHSVSKYEGGQCRENTSTVEGDSFSRQVLYDELGRCVRDSKFAADGFLFSSNEYDYYGDGSQYSRYYYAEWNEEFSAYRESEYFYSEDGTAVDLTWKDADGSLEHHENDEKGRPLLIETFYANGQPKAHTERSYHASTGEYAEEQVYEWDEDGSFLQESITIYYENGNEKSFYLKNKKGDEYYQENNENRDQTFYTETKNGVLRYRDTREYHANGWISRHLSESFREDGQPDSLNEDYYLENGDLLSHRYVYDDGSSEYYEYKDDKTVLHRRFYPSGNLLSWWYPGEGGISYQYEYYESGQTYRYYEFGEESTILRYERYSEAGVLTESEINNPDGTYDQCRFSEETGLIYRQYLKDATGRYERTFEKGRITREIRWAANEEGTYLGYTDWYYFEDGGVKKVRISIYDGNNDLVSETVEDDKD